MSWDEKVFGKFYSFLLKTKSSFVENDDCLRIEKIRRQSEVLISALCETKIEIRESSGWGGFQNTILFLPEKISFLRDAEDQLLYLEWRLLAASVEFENKGIDRSLNGIKKVIEKYPKLQRNYEKLLPFLIDKPMEIWFGATRSSVHSKSEINNLEKILNHKEALSKGTEIKGHTQDRAKLTQIDEHKESPLTHVFEKVLTAEDYQGGHRKMDGRDEMSEHGDALSELSLSHVLRTQQSSHSIFKSNAIVEVADLEIDEIDTSKKTRFFQYPEWFERKGKYKKNWCTLFENDIFENGTPLPFNKKIASDLKSKLETSFSSYQWISRQKEGPEIDLKMAIDRFVQSQVGGALTDNIYLQKQKHNHDFAIQIIVDSSLSTDSYASGRRIIDTIQEALNIFAFAFTNVVDSISIATFSSYTRNKITYNIVKEFNDPWCQVPSKISVLKPEGYTRIGPALRHSRFRLENVKSKKKMVLLLSDAKPTDYDHYEGHHGINDIQRAVTELNSSGCKVKVLTLTDKKQSHHNFVFGTNNCVVLRDVKELSNSLFHFWRIGIC
jgi:nitric oxide reductase NorD protein